MQRAYRSSRGKLTPSLNAWAVVVFALGGAILQVAILMSGYWSAPSTAPAPNASPGLQRPVQPVPSTPQQRRSVPIEPLAARRDRA